MTSGKILATVVGVAAAAILITQLASNKSEEEPLVEHWNMNPTMGIISERSYTCAKTGKNVRARDLTSGLPDSVFFHSFETANPSLNVVQGRLLVAFSSFSFRVPLVSVENYFTH